MYMTSAVELTDFSSLSQSKHEYQEDYVHSGCKAAFDYQLLSTDQVCILYKLSFRASL